MNKCSRNLSRLWVLVFYFSFVIADITHLNQKLHRLLNHLEPPFYVYDQHHNHYYVPPIASVTVIPTVEEISPSRPTTTEFSLPEIIINRSIIPKESLDSGPSQYDANPRYIPPTQQEPSDADQPYNTYIPPQSRPETVQEPPNIGYLPSITPTHDQPLAQNDGLYDQPDRPDVQFDEEPAIDGNVLDPIPQYLPAARQPESRQLKGRGFSQPLRLTLQELQCLAANKPGGYFRAKLLVQSTLEHAPVIDSETVRATSECDIRFINSRILINIAGEEFERCAVKRCDSSAHDDNHQLCLKLRFPQIKGMTTLGDSILTLQCQGQKRVVTKTHALHVGVSRDSQARAAGTFAVGGIQQPYRTQISLYRMANGGVGSVLTSGATVQLGDELMIRAHVKAGDGWNYTRLSDVSLQRYSANGAVLNSANLLTSAGCVHPAMRSICPAPPVFEQPLGYRFGFRAVMFQGMKSGDEMVISVKILGCMQQIDCFVDDSACDRHGMKGRRRRHSDSQSDYISSDVSMMSYRVDMPNSDPPGSRLTNAINPLVAVGIAATVIMILLGLLIGLYVVYRRRSVWGTNKIVF